MPKDPNLNLKKYNSLQAVPFWITLDYEAFNIP